MATLVVPADIPDSWKNDVLPINISISNGAQVNSVLKQEGMRILIVRENYGQPVAKDAIVVVDDIDAPIEISLKDNTTHLRFIIINAYVAEKTVDVVMAVPNGIVLPNFCLHKVGDTININGSGFGSSAGSVIFHVDNENEYPATISKWSDTQITLTIPGNPCIETGTGGAYLGDIGWTCQDYGWITITTMSGKKIGEGKKLYYNLPGTKNCGPQMG